MKDVTLLFCTGLTIVLGLTSLDRTLHLISSSAASNATHGLPGFYSSFETALNAARTQDKLMVLVFGRASDPDTSRLKSEVLLSSNVNAVKEQFVWAYIDMDQPHQQFTVQRFAVKTSPHTCLVTTDGEAMTRLSGTTPAYFFVQQLTLAAKKAPNAPSRATKPASNPAEKR